jgi:hypothetical protein
MRCFSTKTAAFMNDPSQPKSLYRFRGVFVAGVNVYGVRYREQWQAQLASSSQMRAVRLYDHLDFLSEQKKQAEADLLREAKKHPIVRILETTPGFGPIRAARLAPIEGWFPPCCGEHTRQRIALQWDCEGSEWRSYVASVGCHQ